MYTSGEAAPPEIVVIRLARLVSVSVGADCRVTWIFGYAFSNALISTVRGSGLEVVMGLAHQVMLPLVAAPLALGAGAALPLELDEPLLPQAATLSATAALAAAIRNLRFLMRYHLAVIFGFFFS
jgi:hypothetical protein